jgi:hypothetical protein
VSAIAHALRPVSEARRRRGLAGQRTRRLVEQRVRRHAVAFRRWASVQGLSIAVVAQHLGIRQRTLQSWETGWKRERLRVEGRGRPTCRSDRPARQQLLSLIGLLGPRIGVPTLQALCPQMARREVQDVLRRYRKVWKRRQKLLASILHWKKPGSVWAVDFAEPPLPIEGCYVRLLAVRDLASGFLPWTNRHRQPSQPLRHCSESMAHRWC